MNQLTLDLIKLAFLAVLWLFVIAAVGVVRTDTFDQPASARRRRRGTRQQSRQAPATGPIKAARPARSGRSTPRLLLVTAGNLAGTTITLTDQQITIGRAADATLVLTDDYASSGTPGCIRRTASGSWRISARPTARTWTGRR